MSEARLLLKVPDAVRDPDVVNCGSTSHRGDRSDANRWAEVSNPNWRPSITVLDVGEAGLVEVASSF